MEKPSKKQSKILILTENKWSVVGEDDINEEMTEKYRKDPKHQRFLDWCIANGLKQRGVNNIELFLEI